VNGERVSVDYCIGNRDELRHTVHRHEPAVVVGCLAPPYFAVVAETEEVVAFDKPAAIPIHACGAYHRNSLMPILENETRFGKLYTIHRLDRLTSGLVVLAKSSRVAKIWGKAISDRTCEKIYLARVNGRFGSNITTSVPMLQDGSTHPELGEWPWTGTNEDNRKLKGNSAQSLRERFAHGYWITNGNGQACNDDRPWAIEHSMNELLLSLDNDDDTNTSKCIRWLTLACPVRLAQPKDGVCASGPFPDLDDAVYVKTVKPAQTSFAIVRYFPLDDTTLIMARPATGRTHQIRLHLYHLGHCIANDPNYGGDMWFGDQDGQAVSAKAQETLEENTSMMISSSNPATEAEVCTATSIAAPSDETLEETVKRTCVWCSRLGSLSATQQALQEFQVRSPGLWLHALRYRISKESTVVFQTDVPKWAAEEPHK
jgi:23S rRNA-/tRNA-specific pseudouridylate synthase